MGKMEGQGREREMHGQKQEVRGRGRWKMLILKMEEGDTSQGGQQLLEAGKGKETDCLMGF